MVAVQVGEHEAASALCPTVEAARRVGGVWRLIVIWYLMDGAKGFNDLLKAIPSSNSKTISRTLKLLQKEGIIERRVLSLQPFSVEYSLTEKGRALKPVLEELRKWGKQWGYTSGISTEAPDHSEEQKKPYRAQHT